MTEEEFVDFCEGQSDPMLKYIDREEKNKAKLLLNQHSRYLEKQSTELGLLAGAPGAGGKRPSVTQIRFENTYRMQPTAKFFPDKAEAIIKSVLEEALKDKPYDFKVFSGLISELSDRIKERVKESMYLPRYKLVSFVTAGQVKDQGVKVGSRCVWNAKCDQYASASYSNTSVFAVGVVYAAYFE